MESNYMLEIIILVFGLILSALGTVLILMFKDLKTNVGKMSGSMEEMNTEMTKVVTNQTWHHREMKEIKSRINDLENKDTI